MGLTHNTLVDYYQLIFMLSYIHKYSLTEIESLIPFERDLIVEMIRVEIERQKQELENL